MDPAVVAIHIQEQDPLRAPGTVAGYMDAADGSGVLISRDGKVLTAAHVVQTADRVLVEFSGGEQLPAHVVGSSRAADVALLQVEHLENHASAVPAGAAVAPLGDSDRVEVGDPIFLIGAPLGLTHTLTAGHIGGRVRPRRTGGLSTRAEFLQIDATIQSGSSGGPVCNLHGEVVGIVSSVLVDPGSNGGIGIVATSNVARDLLLADSPRGSSFWSGVEGTLLVPSLARMLNVPQPCGYLVEYVAHGSLAERLGLRGGTLRVRLDTFDAPDDTGSHGNGVPGTYSLAGDGAGGLMDDTLIVGGDIILSVNGNRLTEENTRSDRALARLTPAASSRPHGKTVVEVLRGGHIVTLTLPGA
jgi:S1-C subfamily serine protease